MIEYVSADDDAARLPWEAWDTALAARLAALPIPRPTYGLWPVLAPGSRRVHYVATVDEVVRMLTPTWEVIEPRWVAVRTGCGRSGPFTSPWPRGDRQSCRRCLDAADAWEGYAR